MVIFIWEKSENRTICILCGLLFVYLSSNYWTFKYWPIFSFLSILLNYISYFRSGSAGFDFDFRFSGFRSHLGASAAPARNSNHRKFSGEVTPSVRCGLSILRVSFLLFSGTIHNFLLVLRAVLCDYKIIVTSTSRARVSDAAYAVRSLLYPFQYWFDFDCIPSGFCFWSLCFSHTYVSVLPELLLDYLDSPTPFIMGVLKTRALVEHNEAIVVDLDIGSVVVPDKSSLPPIPDIFYQRIVDSLQLVCVFVFPSFNIGKSYRQNCG